MKGGRGWPVRVSVDRIPSMLDTFDCMNSIAFSGVSALKTTTASCAPKVAQAPCTSIFFVGLLVSLFRLFVTEFMRGASAFIRQM